MIFKIRYAPAGGHMHCTLFVAPGKDRTFAKCGDLKLRLDEFDALHRLLPDVPFIEESLASLEGHRMTARRRG